jgi:serine/threonine-protein kinase HipA
MDYLDNPRGRGTKPPPAALRQKTTDSGRHRQQFAALVSDTAAGRPIDHGGRFSVAGVQRKFVIARHPGTGDFLLPQRGAPSTHIVKVESSDSRSRGLIANEALCLAVLRRLGLPAVSAERVMVGGIPILVIPRYDRAVTAAGQVFRRHQEDAAQVLGLPRELKYEDAATTAGVAAERRGYAGLFGPFAGAMRSPADTDAVVLRGGGWSMS